MVGTFVLYFLETSHTGLSALDAFFIVMSAICVTGLTSVDFSAFAGRSQVRPGGYSGGSQWKSIERQRL